MTKVNLLSVDRNKNYKIVDILIDNMSIQNQLKNFGMQIGCYIKVITTNYRKQSFLISIDGCCFAIDKKICEKIFVDE